MGNSSTLMSDGAALAITTQLVQEVKDAVSLQGEKRQRQARVSTKQASTTGQQNCFASKFKRPPSSFSSNIRMENIA